jgi:hypothetical protein
MGIGHWAMGIGHWALGMGKKIIANAESKI